MLIQGKGFTLIEVVISIVAFAVAFTVLTVALYPANQQSAYPVLQTKSAELAQAYMDEIIGKRFDENSGVGSIVRCGIGAAPACTLAGSFGPEGAETRATFDDVDDYQDQDGLPDAATDPFGNPRASYASYTVLINVSYAGTDIGLPLGDAKRIDVTVNAPEGGQITLSVYRSNF